VILTGTVVEIGELEHLNAPGAIPAAGMVVLVPREQLEALKESILYRPVNIELKPTHENQH